MKFKLCMLLASTVGLGGCVSTSFAPPEVDLYHKMNANSLTADCRLTDDNSGEINHDVDGALLLIHGFVNSYRCSMRAAADGRQPFEILSFLSLAGSTAAVALGASPDAAIVGTGANSIFTAGNNYYAPQEQTEILSSAVDALLCIQTEAVGIPAFESTVARGGEEAPEVGEGSSVEVSAERQYFNMVTAALLSVERVAAQRLSRRGSFDAAGVAAELEVQRQRLEEARAERRGEGAGDQDDEGGEEAMELVDQEERAVLRLEELRPQLQMCVARAKV